MKLAALEGESLSTNRDLELAALEGESLSTNRDYLVAMFHVLIQV